MKKNNKIIIIIINYEKDTSTTRTGILPQCQYTSTFLTHAIYIHAAPPTCSIIHNGVLLPSIIKNTLPI